MTFRIVSLLLTSSLFLANAVAAPARGPLQVHPNNPCYFTDGTRTAGGSFKAVYLTGSHTWANLQDQGATNPPPRFDYGRYVDFLLNGISLWP